MNSSSWDVANCQQGKQWEEGKLLPPLAQPTGKVKEAICGFLREIVAGSLQTGSSSRHRYNSSGWLTVCGQSLVSLNDGR
jgi:hypothetical protein